MPRLIDADALEKRHCENCGEIAIEICKNDPVCATLMWVREEETIDPESLRPHGRWLKTQEPLGWNEVDCVECSECHESWVVDMDYGYDFLEFWHYCPNCGAKMDLEEDT